MNKPFLLIAGDHYYPEPGINNWIGTYETMESVPKIKEVKHSSKFRKDEVEYEIEGREGAFDWYEIVDLRDWQK